MPAEDLAEEHRTSRSADPVTESTYSRAHAHGSIRLDERARRDGENAPSGVVAYPTVERRRRRTDPIVRAIDIVVAGVLIVVLAPLMLVVAFLIRRDSAGPALYRARRLGLERRPITVLKFRTMRHDADDRLHRDYVIDLLTADDPEDHHGSCGGTEFKLDDDPRVTSIGRRLRSTSLDEIPQLFNVLRGNMSLVGPRPEVPYALAGYEAWNHERFGVRPGLSGLWQVSGRGNLSPRDMLALDVEYARRRGLLLDLWILLRTPSAVLRRTGAQ